MGPVTKEKLASNAFRTLGLSGSAGQSAIEAAARRMRIWPDASRVPPTPWDMPNLGPIRRSKSDVDQAVALLNQPESRLEHRLLWFCGDRLPTVAMLPAPAIAPAASTASLTDRHAEAIANLCEAWARPDSDDGAQWSAVIGRMVEVCGSPNLLAWSREMERSGQFDKRASDDEIAAMVAAMPAAVAAGVIQQATSALNDGRIGVVTTIASAVRLVPASPGADGPIRDLLDRIEDSCNARCGEMEKDLRDNLRIVRQSPEQSYPGNLDTSTRANDFYVRNVLPTMSALLRLAAEDPDRLVRLRTRCGELLVLLALGWEWSGRFVLAEQQLQNALKVAQGTVTELEVRRELDRVGPLAAAEREQTAQELATRKSEPPIPVLQIIDSRNISPSAHRPRPRPAKKNTLRAGLAIAGGTIWLVRLLIWGGSRLESPTTPSWVPPANAPTLSSQQQSQLQSLPDPASIAAPLPADPPKQSVGDSFREP